MLRDRAEAAAVEERERAAKEAGRAFRRARYQARCNRVQLLYQLDPTAAHARQVKDLIAVLDELGESD